MPTKEYTNGFIRNKLIQEEGIAKNVYADTSGYLTFGIGHLMTADDIKRLGLSKYVVKEKNGYKIKPGSGATTKTIKEGSYKPDEKTGSIDNPSPLFNAIHINGKPIEVPENKIWGAFNSDSDKLAARARKAIPKLDTFTPEQQAAIVSGFYRGDLAGSPKTLALINEGKFEEASKEFLVNKEYQNTTSSGIRKRMENISKMISSLGQPTNKPVQFADAGSPTSDAMQPGVGTIPVPESNPQFEADLQAAYAQLQPATPQQFAMPDDPWQRMIYQAEQDTGVYRNMPYEQPTDINQQPENDLLSNPLLDWMMPWRR